ncbi:MAG: cbb3-type cytochrome c oxidase subunit 3 [Pseudomonadota bacterium]
MSVYQLLASFAQTGGLIYFVAIFIGVLAYALWPKNQTTLDAAAKMPLQDEGPGHE